MFIGIRIKSAGEHEQPRAPQATSHTILLEIVIDRKANRHDTQNAVTAAAEE